MEDEEVGKDNDLAIKEYYTCTLKSKGYRMMIRRRRRASSRRRRWRTRQVFAGAALVSLLPLHEGSHLGVADS